MFESLNLFLGCLCVNRQSCYKLAQNKKCGLSVLQLFPIPCSGWAGCVCVCVRAVASFCFALSLFCRTDGNRSRWLAEPADARRDPANGKAGDIHGVSERRQHHRIIFQILCTITDDEIITEIFVSSVFLDSGTLANSG